MFIRHVYLFGVLLNKTCLVWNVKPRLDKSHVQQVPQVQEF